MIDKLLLIRFNKLFFSFSLVDITRFHMARVNFFKNQGILSLLLIVMVIFSMVPKVKAWTEGNMSMNAFLKTTSGWLTFVH